MLCVVAAAKTTVIAASAFTLSWTHSAQKTEWIESWAITETRLQLSEARVRGSGAGMEPPEGSRLVNGWWVYAPNLPAQRSVLLASSGATSGGWRLCAEGQCIEIGKTPGEPITLSACDG